MICFRRVTSIRRRYVNSDIILHHRILGRDKLFGRKKDAFI